MSFDVVSLFTNVLVDKALEVIKRRLEEDITLSVKTELGITAITELLTVC